MKVVIASHISHSNEGLPGFGTGEGIASFIASEKYPFLFIKHALYDGWNTRIEEYDKKIPRIYYKGLILSFPFRIIQEIYVTLHLLYKHKPSLYIGIDPLNALYGIFGRIIGIRYRLIYYTADYANIRFRNRFLNAVYHYIDSIALRFSDEVWNISTRINNLRKKQGIKNSFFVPNILFNKKIIRIYPEKRNSIILISTISYAYIDFPLLLKDISTVIKYLPGIRVNIIGSGPDVLRLKKEVIKMKLEKNIYIIGAVPHRNLSHYLNVSNIGLALYTGYEPWTYYGDSMKTREYLSYGIPVIITKHCSTSDDISANNMGIVIPRKKGKLANALLQMLSNKKLYAQMRMNALQYSKYDSIYTFLQTHLINA